MYKFEDWQQDLLNLDELIKDPETFRRCVQDYIRRQRFEENEELTIKTGYQMHAVTASYINNPKSGTRGLLIKEGKESTPSNTTVFDDRDLLHAHSFRTVRVHIPDVNHSDDWRDRIIEEEAKNWGDKKKK